MTMSHEPGQDNIPDESVARSSPAAKTASPTMSQRLLVARQASVDAARATGRWLRARVEKSRARRAKKDARLLESWSKWGPITRWRHSRPLRGSILLILAGALII